MKTAARLTALALFTSSSLALAAIPNDNSEHRPVVLQESRSGNSVDNHICKLEKRRGESLSHFCH